MSAFAIVLLTCTPTMLLCRPVPSSPSVFDTSAQCETALAGELHSGRIGRCQEVSGAWASAGWKVTHFGTLETWETIPEVKAAGAVGRPVDPVETASTVVAAKPADQPADQVETASAATGTANDVVIRVTRGTAVEEYVVPRGK